MARLVAVVVAVGSLTAQAQEFVGTGRDGARRITSRVTVNRYTPLAGANPAGSSSLSVAVADLIPGELLLLHQSQLPTMATQTGLVTYLIDDPLPVGRSEWARVTGLIDGGTYQLDRALQFDWGAGAQAIVVPEFTSLEVTDAGAITALPWDGAAGGVVALLVAGPLVNDGLIEANGKGFRACQSDSAGEGINRAGFCVESQASVTGGWGASGGSNAGRGGVSCAGNWPGNAARIARPGSRFLFGGAGGRHSSPSGSFSGGPGGGALLIRADEVRGSGAFEARGNSGLGPMSSTTNYGGGGGAGGTIDLRARGAIAVASITASGGKGGDTPNAADCRTGGGGGGGSVHLVATSVAGAVSVRGGLRGSAAFGVNNSSTPAIEGAPEHEGIVTGTMPGAFVDGGVVGLVSLRTPAANAVLATVRPAVAGTSTGEVAVLFDGQQAGTASPVNGVFAFAPTADLAEGSHTVEVRELTSMATTGAVPFTLDVTPPEAPTVLAPREGDVVSALPTIQVSAPPATFIDLQLNGDFLGSFVSDAKGTVVTGIPVQLALARGSHVLSARARDRAGNTAEARVSFSVGRELAAPAQVVSSCQTGQGGLSALALVTWAFRAWAMRRR